MPTLDELKAAVAEMRKAKATYITASDGYHILSPHRAEAKAKLPQFKAIIVRAESHVLDVACDLVDAEGADDG